MDIGKAKIYMCLPMQYGPSLWCLGVSLAYKVQRRSLNSARDAPPHRSSLLYTTSECLAIVSQFVLPNSHLQTTPTILSMCARQTLCTSVFLVSVWFGQYICNLIVCHVKFTKDGCEGLHL